MSETKPTLSRRKALQAAVAGGAAPLAAAAGLPTGAGAGQALRPFDWALETPRGTLHISALSERAMRVRFVPSPAASRAAANSLVLQPGLSAPALKRSRESGRTRLELRFIRCEVEDDGGPVRFFDRHGSRLLAEAPGSRRLTASKLGDEVVFQAEQGFESPPGERLYGTGCFQDGAMVLRGHPRLTQVNTQISLPFLLSSRGYGLLWHNEGMAELNPPGGRVKLERVRGSSSSEVVDVTTTSGNAQVTRNAGVFEGGFRTEAAGRFAFLLDVGRPMGSRHSVQIDGRSCIEMANPWLPPTAGFIVDLPAGEHRVRVQADEKDEPALHFGPVADRTVWRSPVADAIDYVVIAGPGADEVMQGYREISGATPVMPRWAYGYIHCRERFHSSQEIVDTLSEFRRRKLPVDVMVQDWQYWGRHGWNAMRFDEAHYPDPAALVRDLHRMDGRLMLSVWARVGRDTELGASIAARGHYIDQTDWVDFFDPKAAAFYWQNQRERLLSAGIDAWWQDATEPENDDLVGRRTAAGRGERVRLSYPWHVTRTVYSGQRQAAPDKRVMILTRSAFPGQHRHAAATWSGDIGNDWDTLKRQIPAGLGMAAAGYAYWTVDAGGFFRPGDGQYKDQTEATGELIDLHIVPGRDGSFDLYEDGGLDNSYETGGRSLVRMTWDDRRSALRISPRQGRFEGMRTTQRFRLHRVGPGQPPMQSTPVLELVYTGRATEVRLA